MNFRSQVKTAAAWQTVYQLMRRYKHKYDLQVYETHPCDGQYWCLSLYSKDYDRSIHLADINLVSGRMHLWRDVNNVSCRKTVFEEESGSLTAYLLHERDPKDVIDRLSLELGFPKIKGTLPATKPDVLLYGIAAGIFEHFTFSRRSIYLASIIDSGIYSSNYRKGTEKYPQLKAWTERAVTDLVWATLASKYWLLIEEVKNGPEKSLALFNFEDGTICFESSPGEEWQTFIEYKGNGHKLAPIVYNVLERTGLL